MRALTHTQARTHAQTSSRTLVKFAVASYMISNVVAVLVYPAWGLLFHVVQLQGFGWLLALAVARLIQYCFLNQLGDAALELSRPHWLATFDGLLLNVPGCCCGLGSLARPATSETLALYMTIQRVLLSSVMALLYIGLKDSTNLRWALLLTLAIATAYSSMVLFVFGEAEAQGIIDERVMPEHRNLKHSKERRWPIGPEWTLVLTLCVVQGAPTQGEF